MSQKDWIYRKQCKILKCDLERDFAAGVYLSEAPTPPRFLSWGGRAI